MLAKEAKTIVDDHLENEKISKTSKTILSDIALKAKKAGYSGPFAVKKVAIVAPETDNFEEEAKPEETSEEVIEEAKQ